MNKMVQKLYNIPVLYVGKVNLLNIKLNHTYHLTINSRSIQIYIFHTVQNYSKIYKRSIDTYISIIYVQLLRENY